jgi:predicted DNA-binding protein (UPF0251 family)
MTTGTSKRKSEALTKEEFTALKQYAKKFRTGVECAETIGIHRAVLDRVLLAGSGAPETIEKIRIVITNTI